MTSALLWVDGLIADFCSSLNGALREEARRLPFTLGLAPEPHTPWSRVFSHEVTLAAPWMIAEAMPAVEEDALAHALLAHALAVIDAMGLDRIADGQVEATPALMKVLALTRARRDEHLALCLCGRSFLIDPEAADRELVDAMRQEVELLRDGAAADFAAYEEVSARKQAVGLLAVTALAARAGLAPARCRAARRALLGVALGLQLYDDVIDWEEDAARGRCWALWLARSTAPAAAQESARGKVHRSGVLVRMLRRARFHFRAASRRALAIGARRLAVWASERAELLRQLADREEASAGYVRRAHALAPWARAVLDLGV